MSNTSTQQQNQNYITATGSEIISYFGVMAVLIAFVLWLIWSVSDDEKEDNE